MSEEFNIVNPAKYSEAEGEFIIEHLGEPVVVALRSAPSGVNPAAVTPLLRRVQELIELEKHEGIKWVGVEAVKEAFALYLDLMRKWRSDKRKNAPRFPSLYTYTKRGRPIWSGEGADNGIVKTYLTKGGTRESLEIALTLDDEPEWNPEWANADVPVEGIALNNELNRWECFCGHTEKFRAEHRGSQNAAKARMSKHLRSATEQVDEHREAYALAFGG